MTDSITPPAGLVDKWSEEWHRSEDDNTSFEAWMLAHAAQWGADQELEACCMEIIDGAGRVYIDETRDRVRLADDIRAARRPNPPSLKERLSKAIVEGDERQALKLLEELDSSPMQPQTWPWP